jgi:hypothetical protein
VLAPHPDVEVQGTGGATWSSLMSEDEQVVTKSTALGKHASQSSLRPTYLRSFARPSELFARIRPIEPAELLFEWDDFEFGILAGSPKASLLRRIAPGSTLDAFNVVLKEAELQITLRNDRPLGSRQTLVVWIYPFAPYADFASADKIELTIGQGGLIGVRGTTMDAAEFEVAHDGAVFQLGFPQPILSDPDAVFVAASVRTNGVQLTHTGWKLVLLKRQALSQVEHSLVSPVADNSRILAYDSDIGETISSQ